MQVSIIYTNERIKIIHYTLPEKQSILDAMEHLFARYLEMRPLFLVSARPINEEWKMRPYLGVFPFFFRALWRNTIRNTIKSLQVTTLKNYQPCEIPFSSCWISYFKLADKKKTDWLLIVFMVLTLKLNGYCHRAFAVLGKNCAKIITQYHSCTYIWGNSITWDAKLFARSWNTWPILFQVPTLHFHPCKP